MESPASWDLLTSSLAVCDFKRLSEAWAFLVLQGLVRGGDHDLQQFTVIVDEVQREGEITGPSKALRIARALHGKINVLPIADMPDPMAEIARSRYEITESWRKGEKHTEIQAHAAPMSSERSWRRFRGFFAKR